MRFWDGEQFDWQPLLTTVNHIIIGKLTIHHTGTLHLRGGAGGLTSKTVFSEPVIALSSKHVHEVKGHVERNGQPLAFPRIHGNWNKAVYATHAEGDKRLMFQPRAPPSHPCRRAPADPPTSSVLCTPRPSWLLCVCTQETAFVTIT